MMRRMIKHLPDFSILDFREEQVAKWKKSGKRGEPPFICQTELDKITGVDCTQKLGSQEIKNVFKDETITLDFVQKYRNKEEHKYIYKGCKIMRDLEVERIYYCLFHYAQNRKESNHPSTQSLGFLYCSKAALFCSNAFIQIVKKEKNKNDALELLKTYHR